MCVGDVRVSRFGEQFVLFWKYHPAFKKGVIIHIWQVFVVVEPCTDCFDDWAIKRTLEDYRDNMCGSLCVRGG